MILFLFKKSAERKALQGVQVKLRPPVSDDFDEWADLRRESRAFLEPWEPIWQPDEFSRLAFLHRIRIYNDRARDDQAYAFFIFDQRHGDLVGGLTLSHVRRGVSQAATLGYWMGQRFARHGYMTDAIKTLDAAAAENFGLHRLEAACLPHNNASRNLLLKCGFEQEGYAKSYVKIAGRWEDHLLFGKLTSQS